MMRGDGRGSTEEDGEESIIWAIRRLKDGKAAGIDGIPGKEVWRYGEEELERWVEEFLDWIGGGWPENWRERLIVPMTKKGEERKVGDYRGVTLVSTLYKVYTTILVERILEKEGRGKGIIPQIQTGFRKGMETIDNMYVLNYVTNRQIGRRKTDGDVC